MLVFHHRQFEAIAAAQEARYCEELLAWFRQHDAQALHGRGDDELRSTIANALQRARARGVATATGLLRYVSLAVLVNPAFDELEAVRNVFEAPGFDPDFKVQLLSELLIARLDDV